MNESFRSFLEASLNEPSPNGGPTSRQMAALCEYTKVALLAQQETNFFTPTINQQISSIVLTQKFPAVYFAGHFFPYREDNSTTNYNLNGSLDGSNGLYTQNSRSEGALNEKETAIITTSSSRNNQRELEQAQQYAKLALQDDEEASSGNDNRHGDGYSDEADEGPPILQKFESTPSPSLKSTKKSAKKSDSRVRTTKKSPPDGFKHPKKPINFERAECPQLVPNAPYNPQQYSDPSEPLEEWFLCNLTDPFPTPNEFNKLQFLSNFGHLDIRNWFHTRRKIFCKQNPKSRPWAKKKSAALKRLSSIIESNDEEINLMMEETVAAKKIKSDKLEMSELQDY